MERIGVGIVGCGWVAGEHVKAFQADRRSEVRALVSRNVENATRYRDQYDLDCLITTDFGEMLEQDDVHVVVVCTPHNVHTEYVVGAAEAGKHVLAEKPMALTLEEIRRQQDAVRKANVRSLVSFVLHWNPLLMTIDRLIDQGVFGNIFMVEVDYQHRIWMSPEEKWLGSREQSGTAILTAGCHAIDALRWFARSPVREVSAYQTQTENPIEYPGTISVNMDFADGKVGRSTTSFDVQMPYRFHIGVYGTEATLLDDKLYAPELCVGQKDYMQLPCDLPDSGDVEHHPFLGQASHLLDCIIEDTKPFPDFDDAARTHLVCLAADKSAQERRPVALKEFE